MENRLKGKIIIAHGAPEIRAALCAILHTDCEILQAQTGREVLSLLESQGRSISLLLLGTELPEMDGFGVLGYLNRYHWIDELPAIIIAGPGGDEALSRAYDLGAMDHIEAPFDPAAVRRRVSSAISIYGRQRRLAEMVAEEMYQREKGNKLMVSILSHIVEFRNGESGLHVMHVGAIAELLLKALVQKTNAYGLGAGDISRIVTASALHDIGKISIDEKILNKNEPLTQEEFRIMKTHPLVGAQMMKSLPFQQDDPLVKDAHDICRWHHERYDGGGYPDGLAGEEIPIAAQVVSVADVYDALVSARSYKAAYSHNRALHMILDGQCGAFNPLLLECLQDCSEQLERALHANSYQDGPRDLRELTAQMLRHHELSTSAQLLSQLEWEQRKSQFYAAAMPDIAFSYQANPPMLSISPQAAELLELDGARLEGPFDPEAFMDVNPASMRRIVQLARHSSPEHPHFSMSGLFRWGGRERWCQCSCQAFWTADDPPRYAGVVGRLIDLQQSQPAEEMNKQEAVLRFLQEHEHSGGQRVSGQELHQLCRYLRMTCDGVRLVDFRAHSAFSVDPKGRFIREGQSCHGLWGQEKPCENCVAQRALANKSRVTKFEFAGEELYQVAALYLEVDGAPYALELISRVGNETLLDGREKSTLAEGISRHNDRLYTDSVTQLHNRRYYEEQLRGLNGISAVVWVDVDDFRQVNEAYGHQAGDSALRTVSRIMLSKVRCTDSVVRYDGNRFLMVFRSIPREALYRKLETIRREVERCRVDGYPMLRLTVSIGGMYGPGNSAEMLLQADKWRLEAKKVRNKTCLG